MAGVFISVSALLLTVALCDALGPGCERQSPIKKKVGDTVMLPACSNRGGVTTAHWKHNNDEIAEFINNDFEVKDNPKFKGRAAVGNPTLDLEVSSLTLQDSGEFLFVSADRNGAQQRTITIELQVYESITKVAVVEINSTWLPKSNACEVFLECTASHNNSAAYVWTIGDHIYHGSALNLSLPEGGELANCNVSNPVSSKSESKNVKCRNGTFSPDTGVGGAKRGGVYTTYIAVGAGGLVLILLLAILVVACHLKKKKKAILETLYADVAERGPGMQARQNNQTAPETIYDAVDDIVTCSVPPQNKPNTIYAMIQRCPVADSTQDCG